MSQENVETVRSAFEAWNAGDLDRVIELVDPELEFVPFRSQLDGASYVGADGMRQFARDSAEEWEYLQIAPDEFRYAGDRVLMVGRYDARGRASGVDIEFPAAWVAQLRNGKIVHLRSYSDRDVALEAAGMGE
jgi:ketosteroid isomerase-like protein